MRGSVQPRAVMCRVLVYAAACGAALSMCSVGMASAAPAWANAEAAGSRVPGPPLGRTSEPAQARRLATTVVRAKTAAARARALTSVMRALGVGVTTAGGRPVVVGIAKGAASRMQLYDFELRALAAALGRGQRESYASVAAGLTSAGFTLGSGRELPAELVQEAVISAVRSSQRRGARGFLLVHLVRQLGLLRGDDPAAGNAPARLDPLQAWLVRADFAMSALRKLAVPRTSRLTTARVSAVSPDVCQKYREAEEAAKKALEAQEGKAGAVVTEKIGDKFTDAAKDQLSKAGTRWAIKNLPAWAVRGAWKVGKAAKRASDLTKILHGSLLALSVSVTTPDAALPEAHWGHGRIGGVVEFTEKVEMLDDYGDLAVKCGALVELELPPKGPIKDVDVNWGDLQGEVRSEGALDCPPPSVPVIGQLLAKYICMTKTGADGIARLRLTLNGEANPGLGIQTQNTGVMGGTALYQSAAGGGITGFIGQFLFPRDGGGTRWFIASHQCGATIPAKPLAATAAAHAKSAQTGGYCPVPKLTGTITYHLHTTNTFAPYYVDNIDEQITVNVRIAYDSYDEDTATFTGARDDGSTMTATYDVTSNNDPPGCSYVKSAEHGQYSGPVDAGIEGGFSERALGVPAARSPSLMVTSQGEALPPMLLSDECLPLESDTAQREYSFALPQIADAKVTPGSHSVTFNYAQTNSGGVTENTVTLSGTLTWNQPTS